MLTVQSPCCLLVGKIIEKCIQKQIVHHMIVTGQWCQDQHAYRHHVSTVTALIEMYETWCNNIENKDTLFTMLVDLSAAFGNVSADILEMKMKKYRFGEDFLQWIHSYMKPSLAVCGGWRRQVQREGASQRRPPRLDSWPCPILIFM